MCSIERGCFAESVIDCVGIANDHTISVTVCFTDSVAVCVVVTVAFNNEFSDANYRSVAGIRSVTFANNGGDAGCAHRITRHDCRVVSVEQCINARTGERQPDGHGITELESRCERGSEPEPDCQSHVAPECYAVTLDQPYDQPEPDHQPHVEPVPECFGWPGGVCGSGQWSERGAGGERGDRLVGESQ